MTHPGYSIASVLPSGEHFTPALAGSIALFARDMTIGSAYQPYITVYGRQDDRARPFSKVKFQPITPSMEFLLGQKSGYARALVQHFRKQPTGLIEVHNKISLFNHLSRHFPNMPISLFLHADPLEMPGAQSPKERWEILARADAIYCCSDYIRRRFLTGLEAARIDHVHVIYHGVTPLKRGKKEPIILYAGRLAPEKGVLELARAAQILLPHFPSWRIVFVGANRPGGRNATSYAHQIGQTLKPLGTQAVFLGHLPYTKVLQLFARAAIVAVPSIWNETTGRTAIEALSHGCALVTSGHGSLAEIAGETGVISTPVTAQGLALSLQGLLEDPETLRQAQQLCVTRGQVFSMTAACSQLDALRYRLLSQAYGG
jgi:glycosyltransferase involved in cell wall biosynthesis